MQRNKFSKHLIVLINKLRLLFKQNRTKTILFIFLTLTSFFCFRELLYARYYSYELNKTLNDIISEYEYVESVYVLNILKKHRSIVVEMDSRFNSFSRIQKQEYFQNDLGNRLQRVYGNWIVEHHINDNNLYDAGDLYFSNIEIQILCNNKSYKYCFYDYDSNHNRIFNYKFIDSNGKIYDYYKKTETPTTYTLKIGLPDYYVDNTEYGKPDEQKGGYVGMWSHEKHYAYDYYWYDDNGKMILWVSTFDGYVDYYRLVQEGIEVDEYGTRKY